MVKVMVQGEWRRRRPRRRWEAGIDTRGRAHSTHSTHRTHSTHSTHAKPAHTHTHTHTHTHVFGEVEKSCDATPKDEVRTYVCPRPPTHTDTYTSTQTHLYTQTHTLSAEFSVSVFSRTNGQRFKVQTTTVKINLVD